MQWRKIASRWRFELDAKSGPLEAGDFGEIGDFGKNRQRAGDMWQPKSAGNDTNRFYLHRVVLQNRLFQHGRRVYITTTKPVSYTHLTLPTKRIV